MVSTYTQFKARCENIQELAPACLGRQGRARSGFLLFEVMVALMILTISSLIVAWYQSHASLMYGQARQRIYALQHARALFERIEQGRERGHTGSFTHDIYVIAWRSEDFQGLGQRDLASLGLEVSKIPLFSCVTVTVGWPQQGEQQSIALTRVLSWPRKKDGT